MECPKCKKEMEIKGQDLSHDSDKDKHYNRTVYWCKDCDVWVSFEIPVKRN